MLYAIEYTTRLSRQKDEEYMRDEQANPHNIQRLHRKPLYTY